MPKKMNNNARILELLSHLEPITLEQMSEIKLMNRTDTKYVTTKEKLEDLLQLAQGHYYAQEKEGNKIADYLTTYWDTDEHFYFMEHHNGRSPRQKVRVRTYMDNGDTFLEIKTKNNHARTKKKRVMVPCQELTAPFEISDKDLPAKMVKSHEEMEEFLQGLVHRPLSDIHPTVRNQFHRITLVNKGKTERLTIDFDIHFHNFETDENADTGNLVIVELKRDGNVYSPVLALLKQLRIKPHGFSKYCIGSCITNKGLKQNRFKPKITDLRKISQGGFHF